MTEGKMRKDQTSEKRKNPFSSYRDKKEETNKKTENEIFLSTSDRYPVIQYYRNSILKTPMSL
jgi:hypothetical protein